jgi:hypothetical protein
VKERIFVWKGDAAANRHNQQVRGKCLVLLQQRKLSRHDSVRRDMLRWFQPDDGRSSQLERSQGHKPRVHVSRM